MFLPLTSEKAGAGLLLVLLLMLLLVMLLVLLLRSAVS